MTRTAPMRACAARAIAERAGPYSPRSTRGFSVDADATAAAGRRTGAAARGAAARGDAGWLELDGAAALTAADAVALAGGSGAGSAGKVAAASAEGVVRLGALAS